MKIIKGNLVDILAKRIYPAEVTIANGKINTIKEIQETLEDYILPGFIDSHIHIESSMLVPSEFARIALKHGTVATVSDPHEIANVCGIQGVEFMLQNSKKVPLKFHFGAPSCVPATSFETAGAILDSKDVEILLNRDDIYYLSEMMNYPGVLHKDPEVMAKIEAAHRIGKPVDGHAPGLMGDIAAQYIHAGISTDHECFTKEEAEQKLKYGMKILIREGSAARNFNALIDLLHHHEDDMMFCCDDKHPDELLLHHINWHVKEAIGRGIDLFKVLKAACVNPVLHYKMKVGLLKESHPADFIRIKDLKHFEVMETYINGECVHENGEVFVPSTMENPINYFNCNEVKAEDLLVPIKDKLKKLRVIVANEGQLITHIELFTPKIEGDSVVSDIENDILKLVVMNRYNDAPIAKAFIKNFGLKEGAIASTIAHDSHNIIAVGVDDQSIAKAINSLVKSKGGIAVASKTSDFLLPLPIAGLMSNKPAEEVAIAYEKANYLAHQLGSKLAAPFMTLSFMALLVIPALKLSDKGLFAGSEFQFVDLFE